MDSYVDLLRELDVSLGKPPDEPRDQVRRLRPSIHDKAPNGKPERRRKKGKGKEKTRSESRFRYQPRHLSRRCSSTTSERAGRSPGSLKGLTNVVLLNQMNAEMMLPSMVNSKMGFLPYLSDTAVGTGAVPCGEVPRCVGRGRDQLEVDVNVEVEF